MASISSQDAIFNLIQADAIAANVVSCAAKKGEQAELSLDHAALGSDRNDCVYNQGVIQVDPVMIQEVGVDVVNKRVLWVKARPDYEPLFSILYGLRPDPGRRYWIKGHGAEVDIGDMGEVMGQIATEVKIAFPVSHKVLTSVEEYVQ